eukprot:GHVL01021498.1.p1 GENE.GHVL01021498.1~~GHVL01021498.1.p1  ORF type:complete len:440 (+),score=91.28 GHVL01021498.1:748-2067(+)
MTFDDAQLNTTLICGTSDSKYFITGGGDRRITFWNVFDPNIHCQGRQIIVGESLEHTPLGLTIPPKSDVLLAVCLNGNLLSYSLDAIECEPVRLVGIYGSVTAMTTHKDIETDNVTVICSSTDHEFLLVNINLVDDKIILSNVVKDKILFLTRFLLVDSNRKIIAVTSNNVLTETHDLGKDMAGSAVSLKLEFYCLHISKIEFENQTLVAVLFENKIEMYQSDDKTFHLLLNEIFTDNILPICMDTVNYKDIILVVIGTMNSNKSTFDNERTVQPGSIIVYGINIKNKKRMIFCNIGSKYQKGDITAVSLSSDGFFLACADSSNQILIYNINDVAQEYANMDGSFRNLECAHMGICWHIHTAKIVSLRWNETNDLLVSASLDGSFTIWNLKAPDKKIRVRNCHPGGLVGAEFIDISNDDGFTVVSAGCGGFIKIFQGKF